MQLVKLTLSCYWRLAQINKTEILSRKKRNQNEIKSIAAEVQRMSKVAVSSLQHRVRKSGIYDGIYVYVMMINETTCHVLYIVSTQITRLPEMWNYRQAMCFPRGRLP